MEMPKSFYIDDEKSLIFRKEENYYINFNPEKLEFIKINLIGAEILYLISINLHYNEILEHLSSKYNISTDIISKDIVSFFYNYSCTSLISNRLKNLEFYM